MRTETIFNVCSNFKLQFSDVALHHLQHGKKSKTNFFLPSRDQVFISSRIFARPDLWSNHLRPKALIAGFTDTCFSSTCCSLRRRIFKGKKLISKHQCLKPSCDEQRHEEETWKVSWELFLYWTCDEKKKLWWIYARRRKKFVHNLMKKMMCSICSVIIWQTHI